MDVCKNAYTSQQIFLVARKCNYKGTVFKLTIKFWICQKCDKMKDYN
jgi:ribosomal protein L37AE/L43A